MNILTSHIHENILTLTATARDARTYTVELTRFP